MLEPHCFGARHSHYWTPLGLGCNISHSCLLICPALQSRGQTAATRQLITRSPLLASNSFSPRFNVYSIATAHLQCHISTRRFIVGLYYTPGEDKPLRYRSLTDAISSTRRESETGRISKASPQSRERSCSLRSTLLRTLTKSLSNRSNSSY